MLETWMKQEIALKRRSGSYFFYGEDVSRLEKIVKNFAKALCCGQSEDFFCDVCETCHRIEKGIYSDLHVLESLKIEDIRSMEGSLYESPYEGDRKVFVLPNVQDLKKESANALLKSIEEPGDGSFFLLWGTQKNILPTILSRVTQVFVPRLRYEELGVSRECYEFFQGQEEEIRQAMEEKLNWQEAKNYKSIRQYLNAYIASKDVKDKIDVYQGLRDFFSSKEYLHAAEKIWFAEEILASSCEREDIRWLYYYYLQLGRYEEGLEERLSFAKILNFPINTKVFLVNLFFQ